MSEIRVQTMTGEIRFLGDVGPTGPKGPMPIKGVDYFTEQDKTEIVERVTEDATNEFNVNAANKTNEFNTNTVEKINEFDENAGAKTNTYNSNAETKVEEYNANATNKTTDFNINAVNKTNVFDDNAEEKTSDFNTNSNTKTNEYNINAIQKKTDFDEYYEEKKETLRGPEGPEGKPGKDGEKGETGNPGTNATINGYNAITLIADEDVEIVDNEDGTFTIKCKTPKNLSELIDDINTAKTNINNNFTAPQTVNGTLTVNGDIVQNGESYETHAEQLYTKNDVIITRDGAVGGLAEGEYTGIEAQKYDGENDGQLVFDANGEARVGDKDDTQPLLTRDEIANLQTGQVLVWDGEHLKAVGSSEFVKNTNYAKRSTAGVVKANPGYGVGMFSSGTMYLVSATNAQIDAKTSENLIISPSNLEYSVRSVLPLSENTLPNPFVAQTEYYLGTQTQITINPPQTAVESQYTLISFTAGTNFSISINGDIIGDTDYVFEDENYYEILLTYNGTNWIMNVLEV